LTWYLTWPALRHLGISTALLVPCFWQYRIQSVDLQSHIYNAWLATLIEQGKAPGLTVVWQAHNVLFDVMLTWLFRAWGPKAAQRIAVSICVLVLFWGAYALARKLSGRPHWPWLLGLAMFCYGWVFHAGFFNFYLSLGISLWALAILWEPSRRAVLKAAPLLALAFLAHSLPVAWAAGVAGYLWLERHIPGRRKLWLVFASALALLALRIWAAEYLGIGWSSNSPFFVPGADQLWVFSIRYFPIYIGLTALWAARVLYLWLAPRARQVLLSAPFQLGFLQMAGILLMPTAVLLPTYSAPLTFIVPRMSLPAGIFICVVFASLQPVVFERIALPLLALAFFSFLYGDTRKLNQLEDRVEAAIAKLPPGQRVISSLCDLGGRVNGPLHILDRACIGRCFSYANYEPQSKAFRVRTTARNKIVLDTYEDIYAVEQGTYTVKARDLPLYHLRFCNTGSGVCLSELRAGEVIVSPCAPGSH